ncbi:hypothetical protein BKA70DRAFT_1426114 [Coprinopsis sp. MPI-PUGE-AT-0042]|nr:hypothetical protein BKA70DRAFT_1426114 [Coprinopsis sp. MPI-PUGE-AT-0042]
MQRLDLQNSYLTPDPLWRHKGYIEGFFPEVARVARAGHSDIEGPVAIRPTSDTAMHPCERSRS